MQGEEDSLLPLGVRGLVSGIDSLYLVQVAVESFVADRLVVLS